MKIHRTLTGQVMPSPESKKKSGKVCAEKAMPEGLPGIYFL